MNSKNTMSFNQWLHTNPEGLSTLARDFIDDAVLDTAAPIGGLREWMFHLERVGACDDAKRGLLSAWRHYRADTKKTPQHPAKR